MPESTLSPDYQAIYNEVSRFFNFGVTAPTSGDNFDYTRDAVRRGMRQFYFPPPLAGEKLPHLWSFLYPTTTIEVVADVAGVNSGAQSGTTINSTGTPFFADAGDNRMVGATIKYTTSGNKYIISSVSDNNTVVITTSLKSADTADALAFTVLAGDYGLPNDFGGLCSAMTFDTTTGYPSVEITSEHRVRSLRMDSRNVESFRPRMAAVRPMEHQTLGERATDGQRFQLLLWPAPDATYTLHYRFLKLLDLAEAAVLSEFPPGGLMHGETIIASCLAVAESMLEPQRPVKRRQEEFMRRLAASVMQDRLLTTPESLGVGVDPLEHGRLLRIDLLDNVTFDGVLY